MPFDSALVEFITRISCYIFAALTWLVMLIGQIRKRIAETKQNVDIAKLAINKENQKEKEEELKAMAKFLCDKCGKETEVKDAKQWRGYDVCPTCEMTLKGRDTEIKQLENTIAQYEKTLSDLKDQLKKKESI